MRRIGLGLTFEIFMDMLGLLVRISHIYFFLKPLSLISPFLLLDGVVGGPTVNFALYSIVFPLFLCLEGPKLKDQWTLMDTIYHILNIL